MKTLSIALFIFGFLSTALADDDFSKIEFKSTTLVPSISMLEGAGGNITALVGTDGVLLVDDDFAEMGDKLVAKLKDLGGSFPRFIINTHFHYDHTGANEKFAKTATIISTTATRDRLMSEQTLWGTLHPAVAPEFLPNLTFDDSLTLHLNGENIMQIAKWSGKHYHYH